MDCPQGTLLLKRLRTILEMVKIEDTLFAVPFALLSAFSAARSLPNISQAGWISILPFDAAGTDILWRRVS
jgi:4-hydroxybenzoate polyprenyltransferase